MKKLLLLGAFVALGYVGVNAQSVATASSSVVSVSTPGEEKPAKADKKEKKSKKHKECGDEKSKSCSGSEKKSCCSSKGHGSEATAPKQEGK